MASLLLLLALPMLAVGDYLVRSNFDTADCSLSATAYPLRQYTTYMYVAETCSRYPAL